MPERKILHADADAFFVSVARLVDPEGAGKARLLIVGGTAQGRGVVCSASYETRAFGVRSAMPVSRALRLCPDAMCVPVPRECSAKSAEIRAALERWTPVVEGASIDEWYLDMTGTEQLYKGESLESTAHRIRREVQARTGLTVSIGGGPSKFVAKLAAEKAKPRVDRPGANGVLIIPPDHVDAFMRTLALADIPGIGPKAQQKLASLSLTTVADALAWPREALRYHFGMNGGDWLYTKVRALDERVVVTRARRKQMSRERTFSKDIADTSALRARLNGVIELVATDLRQSGLKARRITVKLRDADFTTRTATRSLPRGIESDRAIADIARELFEELRRARLAPARLIGVALSGFEGDTRGNQLPLFPDPAASRESDRDRKLSRAVDAVREKFGGASIHLGRGKPAGKEKE
jgi:DNA polymerase-4